MANKMQPPIKGGKNSIGKNIAFSIFILVMVLIGYGAYVQNQQANKKEEVSFSGLIDKVNKSEVDTVTQKGQKLEIKLKGQDKATEYAVLPSGASATEQGLDASKVNFQSKLEENGTVWQDALINILAPILIFGAFFYFMMKQAQGQGNQAMSFGRSKARIYGNEKKKVKFSDIAGNAEAKQDLWEVVEFLKHPKKFEAVGAKIPKGVLLVGSPGTGKTMVARAVAGEANVPFFSISGSEFVEMFVGVGASRVRDLFNVAKKNAPAIIFIDEIDAVGRRRGSGMGGGHDEREQTLNQILVEMDGFEQGQNVIVIAATNRADVLDPALLRPGRFDRRVHIPLPERQDREKILTIHFKNKPVDKTVDLLALSKKTAGMAGADLANLANESAIVAARNNRKHINNSDVTEAFERVAIGPERKSTVMSDKDKELTAYHEGGHALVGHVLPNADPVHKVTIIPRGGTGGVTWSLPVDDKSYHSLAEMKDRLAVSMGGRIAEEIIYGQENVTTGAGSDLESASALARDMVTKQGMGSKLYNQVFPDDAGGMMFDKMTHSKPYSEKTAEEIDKEVESLMKDAYERARKVIKLNIKSLEAIKDALLERETLDDEDVTDLFKAAKNVV
ncbi:MAG TPA: ATP-dependent zinc metalloprotease FtsH [Candidatus Saccharibacteria bacterium]|nr:ATP-dependent zinc metalloprotease FtsH [Candidatus Saccharibacteria bacterium]